MNIGGDVVTIINRIWQMPNSKTFSIKPIEELIHKYAYGQIIDPFANSNKIATITNDLDTQYDTDYHMERHNANGIQLFRLNHYGNSTIGLLNTTEQ